MARKSYEERRELCTNPLLKKLFSIIIEKKSNLCVAADFRTLQETLDFIDRCGKHICILKTHITRFGPNLEKSFAKLYAKKKEYNFLLFEDVKFYDFPDQVRGMYEGTYMKYADLVTTTVKDDSTFEAFELALKGSHLPAEEYRGCLAVCELSFAKDGHATPPNPEKCLEYAARHPAICIGIIAQGLQVVDDCRMIKATPGIHMSRNEDGMGQNWKSPSHVMSQGTDIVIVGRGIIASPADKQEGVCSQYKEAAYKAYLDSLNNH